MFDVAPFNMASDMDPVSKQTTVGNLPRRSLGFFPTPLVELRRLAARLGGPRILMKRDDLTGLALGGNKTRKLELLVGEALAQGCDTLVTGGAAQSNHCRQTAAAAAASGLACHLVLGGEAPDVADGNLLLDLLCGARIHWTGPLRKGEKIPEIAAGLAAEGKKPYVVPYGGSGPIGAAAFVDAVGELGRQLDEGGPTVSHVVFPSSSGGTQAGLVVGKAAYRRWFDVVGIGIDKEGVGEVTLRERVLRLANETARLVGFEHAFSAKDIILREEYLGAGYGIVGDAEREAIRLVAETEGVLLDPVYTGKAMAGLIGMIRERELTGSDTVVFWHTGGAPALFPHARELV